MPLYEFACQKCTTDNDEQGVFTVSISMKDYKSEGECPVCRTVSTKRVYSIPSVQMGRTAAEKTAGTTKQRFESGKRIKDGRNQRKKESDPNSREGMSNEFWVGGESDKKLLGK